MSEPENFLERWSRRKLEEQAPAAEQPAPAAEPEPHASDIVNTIAEAAKAEFDPASLPPLESIDAATDIRAFLNPQVPAELTRAALRRAWESDPTIRDFIGIAENQWDFTNPDGVPGFGPLPSGPEIGRMIANLIEAMPNRPGSDDPKQPQQSAQAPEGSVELPPDAPRPELGHAESENAALSARADVAFPATTDRAGSVVAEADQIPAAAQDVGAETERSPHVAARRHGRALPR